MNEVICIGLSVVDILVRGLKEVVMNGTTTYARGIRMDVGGDVLNQAAVLAKLGHRTGLLTLVGRDTQGDFLLENCRERGIDVSGSSVSGKYPTSTSVVLIRADGERSFISHKGGTVDEFTAGDFDLGQIRPGVRVVSIGSLFSSPAFDREVGAVLKAAKDAGAVTVADLVPNQQSAGFAEIADAMPLLDYIAPSELEARMYTGKDTPEAAADYLLSLGVGAAIIKLGKRGALAATRQGSFLVPPYPAEVADTTGAGDNFMAGFISGLVRGMPLEDCLRFAAATASISIASVGATAGVQSREQVEEVLARNA